MPPGYEAARHSVIFRSRADDAVPLIDRKASNSSVNTAYTSYQAQPAPGVGGPVYHGGVGATGVPHGTLPAYSSPAESFNTGQWQPQTPWEQLQRTGW